MKNNKTHYDGPHRPEKCDSFISISEVTRLIRKTQPHINEPSALNLLKYLGIHIYFNRYICWGQLMFQLRRKNQNLKEIK